MKKEEKTIAPAKPAETAAKTTAAKKAEPVVKAAEKKAEPEVKTAAKKAEPEVKTTAKKAETQVKTAAKKVETAAKTAAKKTTAAAKKTTASVKKAAAPKKAAPAAKKTAAVKESVHLQYLGKDIDVADLVKAAKAAFAAETGKKESDVKGVELYLKTEENRAYYVINGEFTGQLDI